MKVIFLEDRPDRQKQFLPNKSEDVQRIKSIEGVFMPEVNECKTIIESINNESFSFDENIKLIIAHRSAISSKGISHLNNLCKSFKVKLIFFSGGISQTVYNKQNFEQINLNSTDFYSNLLIPFLENFIIDEKTSVLEVFHKEWKLSYLLLYRQLFKSLEFSTDESEKDNYKYRLKNIEEIIGQLSINEISEQIKKITLSL